MAVQVVLFGLGKPGFIKGADNVGPNLPIGDVDGRAGGFSGPGCWGMLCAKAIPAEVSTDKLMMIAHNGRPHSVSP